MSDRDARRERAPSENEERAREGARPQEQPGLEEEMEPQPVSVRPDRAGCGRLEGRRALVTGGDSGIGRAVAVLFAREGADVAIVYLDEHEDAEETGRLVEAEGGRCTLIAGDVGDEAFCREAVQGAVDELGGLDVLVNNASEQHVVKEFTELSREQLERTFRTNVFGMFAMARHALPHLRESGHGCIVNTTSVTAFRGSPGLVDYASTKGAILAFTRSLALNLAEEGIRVNAVAPGPIWTPLIPATFGEEKVASFGEKTPLGRAGQPEEVAPAYVFLASDDGSYITGQTIHPNGGDVVGA